jgi:hypothetical protein
MIIILYLLQLNEPQEYNIKFKFIFFENSTAYLDVELMVVFEQVHDMFVFVVMPVDLMAQ